MNPITPLFVGFATLGVLSQWFLIGGAINFFVLIVIAVGAIVAPWRYGFYYQTHFLNLRNWFKSLSKFTLASFGLILLLILYQSALPTKINDMGAYYLQTLQWMQEYGAVKGLGNLHPALGLGSAWHSLLSMFQLPGLPAFYGINGSLIFTVYLWLTFELSSSFTTKEKLPNPLSKLKLALHVSNNDSSENMHSNFKQYYLFAYSFVFFPLGFLYLTAPSPDLPLLVFTPLLFYWLVLDKNTLNAELFLIIACFVFAVKPPALFAIAAGIFASLKSSQKNNPETLTQILETPNNKGVHIAKQLGINLLIAVLCLTPTLYKNYLQTGYLLYPLSIYNSASKNIETKNNSSSKEINQLVLTNNNNSPQKHIENTPENSIHTSNSNTINGYTIEALFAPKWQIPADWNKAYRQGIVSWGLSDSTNAQVFKGPLPAKKSRILSWLTRPGYKGLMNKLLAINFLLACLLLFVRNSSWLLRGFQLLLLFITIVEWFFLTQYRLMLPTGITLLSLNVLVVMSLVFSRWSLVGRHQDSKDGLKKDSSNSTETQKRKVDIERIRPEPSNDDDVIIKLGKYILILPLVIYLMMAFVPMKAFQKESRNKMITETNGFTSAFLVQPYTDYRNGEIERFMVDSIPFHFYTNRSYTWNAPIPAVSASHRQFLQTNFGYQLRAFSTKIEDGFYLEKQD
jgi:hypothetical protein